MYKSFSNEEVPLRRANVYGLNTSVSSVTDLKEIQQSNAKNGQDTPDINSDDSVYQTIESFCKYRDSQVVDYHKDGEINFFYNFLNIQ